MKKKGLLITFEGIDGCGKSVQVRELAARLDHEKRDYVILREPGGTTIAEKIRSILLEKSKESMSPVAEFLLFSAARAQLTEHVIIPELEKGKIVILDRFYDSSTAYQGYGRGIDLNFIEQVNKMATQGIEPDLTIFLDIPVDEMRRRMMKTGNKLDRMEDQDPEFFENVRAGYLKIAERNSERIHVLDGKSAIDILSNKIWKLVTERI